MRGSALLLRVVPAWFSVVQRGSGRFSHQGAIKLCGDLSKNHNNRTRIRATDRFLYIIKREDLFCCEGERAFRTIGARGDEDVCKNVEGKGARKESDSDLEF